MRRLALRRLADGQSIELITGSEDRRELALIESERTRYMNLKILESVLSSVG